MLNLWNEKLMINSRYYYQYSEERLSACPLTIHGLLHVADDIRFCGPSWTTWTFFMECFIGYLKPVLHSKSQPWSNLNEHVKKLAYLAQLSCRYDLDDELSSYFSKGPISKREHIYDNCKSYYLNFNAGHYLIWQTVNFIVQTPLVF